MVTVFIVPVVLVVQIVSIVLVIPPSPVSIVIVFLAMVDVPVFVAQVIRRHSHPSRHSRRCGRHRLPPVFIVLILLAEMGGRRRWLFGPTPVEFLIVVVPVVVGW